jgi:hypothetical protein
MVVLLSLFKMKKQLPPKHNSEQAILSITVLVKSETMANNAEMAGNFLINSSCYL